MSDIIEPDGHDRVLPGDMTVPSWVLASIVFGLLALTGSLMLLSLVASAVFIAWVIYAGRPDEESKRVPNHPFRGWLGAPGPWM